MAQRGVEGVQVSECECELFAAASVALGAVALPAGASAVGWFMGAALGNGYDVVERWVQGMVVVGIGFGLAFAEVAAVSVELEDSCWAYVGAVSVTLA